MTNLEPQTHELEPIGLAASRSVATWRYLGDRTAADLAYRARFNTNDVPEPTVLRGGTLAYTLPAAEPRR